jgi:uncharacterized membrane protein YdjX (TVP38/TMEM64 family)
VKSRRWVVLALWILMVVVFWWYVCSSHQTATEVLSGWLESLSKSPYSFFLLLVIYIIRPLLFLPITLLTVFTGFLYGVFWGTLYTTLATLVSCAVGYFMGRFLSGDEARLQRKWLEQLRERSFETILVSRLTFLPGDLVNYAAGFLKISFMAFLLATAIGGLPGLLVGVLAGASLETFSASGFKLKPWYIVASLVMLAGSLLLSWWLRQRSRVNQ